MATYSRSKRLIKLYLSNKRGGKFCGLGPVDCVPTKFAVRHMAGSVYKNIYVPSSIMLIVVKVKKNKRDKFRTSGRRR